MSVQELHCCLSVWTQQTDRLPSCRSVCTKLVSGQALIAETFQSATVYFGDIVGFTAMWADSSPLQVTDENLLNLLLNLF